MSTKTALTPERIMQLGLGFWGAKALLSAIELGVFSELSTGALNADQLRARLKLHQRSAVDFFDTLVALGMLERDGGQYRNAADTEIFLVRGKPSYIGGLLEMANERLYPFWGSLTEGLQTGQPQNELKTGGGGLEGLPPVGRVDLGPVGMRRPPLTKEGAGVGVADDHLGRLGGGVDPGDQPRSAVHGQPRTP